MPSAEGELQVFSFKEGILSRVAHDLRLSFTRFQVRFDDETLSATFETESLRVDGAMDGERFDPSKLDAGKRREIEQTLRTVILRTRDYPTAQLEARAASSLNALASGRVASVTLSGELELVGQRRPLSFEARRHDHGLPPGGPALSAGLPPGAPELVAEIELAPSRWGIRPYTALLGAIRLADRVRVVARLRVPGA
jgi:hypothetical protein